MHVLSFRIVHIYCIFQIRYYNLPVVGAEFTDFLWSFQAPCRGGKRSAALSQVLVDKDLVLVYVLLIHWGGGGGGSVTDHFGVYDFDSFCRRFLPSPVSGIR